MSRDTTLCFTEGLPALNRATVSGDTCAAPAKSRTPQANAAWPMLKPSLSRLVNQYPKSVSRRPVWPRGFGFIEPSDGGKDVLVHISALERAGLSSLKEGQKIKYEIARERDKDSAANLSLIE